MPIEVLDVLELLMVSFGKQQIRWMIGALMALTSWQVQGAEIEATNTLFRNGFDAASYADLGVMKGDVGAQEVNLVNLTAGWQLIRLGWISLTGGIRGTAIVMQEGDHYKRLRGESFGPGAEIVIQSPWIIGIHGGFGRGLMGSYFLKRSIEQQQKYEREGRLRFEDRYAGVILKFTEHFGISVDATQRVWNTQLADGNDNPETVTSVGFRASLF